MSITRSITGGSGRVTGDDGPQGGQGLATVRPPPVSTDALPDPISGSGSSPKGYLEIRLNGGAVSRRVLAESHVMIGRVPGVQILLDHHTVSRRHAEMFCDPFGRWWIRDLGSTNGTFVNEETVTEVERVLSPGDRVAIGDFSIAFFLEPGEGARSPRGAVPEEDENPTAIRTLLDFEPPRIAAEHLRTLLEFSRRLLVVENPDDRLKELCQLVVRSDFHGTTAVVLRLQGGKATSISPVFRPAGQPAVEDRTYVSRRVLNSLRETREPVLAGNASPTMNGASLDLTIAREVMELWVIACPLRTVDDDFDVLYVTMPPDCGSVEWLNLFALAAEVFQQSESAWAARHHAQAHAAIERELGTARQIQRALLPKKLDFTGLDVAVGFEPCKWVGGDYVDAVPLPDGRVLLAVADVCGKGLQAALVASSLHTMVRATLDVQPSLSALMERVNRHLCEWLPAHSFVTMVAAIIDPATGEIECVNAGHPPVLIVDRDGDLRTLQSAANPVLGVALTRMETQRALLEFGDVLVMYTDGLTELRNPNKDMLGQDRLGEEFARVCAARPGERSNDMADALRKMLDEFSGDQVPEDDRAFLLAQRR
jgi:serine phosphatase RsbU (regulator of sigma subunit)